MANPAAFFPDYNAVGLTTALTGIAGIVGAGDLVSNSDLMGAIPDQMSSTMEAVDNAAFARYGALLRVTVTWDVCTGGEWTPAGPATFDLTPPPNLLSPSGGWLENPGMIWSNTSVMGLTDGNLEGADAATMAAITEATQNAINAPGQ